MKNDSANNTASVLQTKAPTSQARSGNVSIKDVAARAKVAPSTVSAALSGNGRISDALRAKVSLIATEMNYRPKMAAQLLRANNTGYMGLLLCNNADEADQEKANNDFQSASWYTTHFLTACQSEGLRSQIEFVMPNDMPNSGT